MASADFDRCDVVILLLADAVRQRRGRLSRFSLSVLSDVSVGRLADEPRELSTVDAVREHWVPAAGRWDVKFAVSGEGDFFVAVDVVSGAVRMVFSAARFAGRRRWLSVGQDAGGQPLGSNVGGDQLRLWWQRFVSSLQRCLFGERGLAAVGADVCVEHESST